MANINKLGRRGSNNVSDGGRGHAKVGGEVTAPKQTKTKTRSKPATKTGASAASKKPTATKKPKEKAAPSASTVKAAVGTSPAFPSKDVLVPSSAARASTSVPGAANAALPQPPVVATPAATTNPAAPVPVPAPTPQQPELSQREVDARAAKLALAGAGEALKFIGRMIGPIYHVISAAYHVGVLIKRAVKREPLKLRHELMRLAIDVVGVFVPPLGAFLHLGLSAGSSRWARYAVGAAPKNVNAAFTGMLNLVKGKVADHLKPLAARVSDGVAQLAAAAAPSDGAGESAAVVTPKSLPV